MERRSHAARVRVKALQQIITRRKIIIIGAAIATISVAAPMAYAANYTQQINDLQNQNTKHQAAQSNLGVQAASLQDQIAALQSEVAGLQAQIQQSEAKKAQTEAEIQKAEAELAVQRGILGANVKQLYLNDEMSTLEMLATSKSLSDYIDKEQSLNSVQSKVRDTMMRINELKAKLDADRQTIERLLADQTSMRDSAAAKQAEANRLLALNQQEQASYNARISSNNSKIAELQRLQAIENNRYNIGTPTYGGTGGYPWANVSYPSYSADPWGMYKRECVSYTAWRVAASGRYMPYWGGRGNAKQWDDNARAAGIPVDGNPRVGDVAISNSGTYGHAMYVEAVHGDGTVTVSQYNAKWDGRYSIAKRSVTGLVFIHF